MNYSLLPPILLLASCVHKEPVSPLPPPIPASKILLSDYSAPFGHAPKTSDLKSVFRALPDPLVADMSLKSRELFWDQCIEHDLTDMIDPANGYLSYFSDNPYSPIQASSILYLKVLPSSKYGYVVVIHMVKPSALSSPPANTNTFILISKNGQWIDITTTILPDQVSRDWYFQPLQRKNIVEAGPYLKSPQGYWTRGNKSLDLIWKNSHFEARPTSSSYAN